MARDDSNPPSSGEWAAISGYEPQYSLAAQVALQAAREGVLQAVRLIDPNAGIADDFQIVTDRRIDAHQVKWEQTPSGFTFGNLKSMANGLALGRASLLQRNPSSRVVVHVVTNCHASTNDSVKDSSGTKVGSFFEFRNEILEPSRNAKEPTPESLAKWADVLAELRSVTTLDDTEFKEFVRDLYVDVSTELTSEQIDVIGAAPQIASSDVERVKSYFLRKVRESPGDAVVEITSREMLAGAGLGDRLDLRNRHEFPKPDIDYFPIVASWEQLQERLQTLPGGYVALLGPPGSGKSTLINEEFADPALRVVRYYAFVPGTDLSGFVRGESEHFLHDLNVSLKRLGSHSTEDSLSKELSQKQELVGHLAWLSKDFQATGRRTAIFVDGLDHIPREQRPERSLLADLPLPNQIPDGVYIVLGTQPVELADLPVGVSQEIKLPERRVEMARLTESQILGAAVAEFPDHPKVQLLADRLVALSEGHPLSLAILVRQCRQPPPALSPEEAIERLKDVTFLGTDIDGYYERLWDQVQLDDATFSFLGRACRDRLPIRSKACEAELGRSRFQALLNALGHLWQQDPSGHLHVFHNSFRLFLLRATSTDALGNHDPTRHLEYHRQLVAAYTKADNPLEQWEVVYHQCELNEYRAALDYVTIDRVREQLCHFRLPATLFPDLRVLFRLAFQEQELPKVAELAIAWNELNLSDYALSEQYDSIATELLNAGEYSTALQMLTDGRSPQLGISTCLAASQTLLEAGLIRQAHALFYAAEPLGQLHRQEMSHGSHEDCLHDWARIGGRFRRPQQMVSMIRSAELQSAHPVPGSQDVEETRKQLLAAFAEELVDQDSGALVCELDQRFQSDSRPAWLSLRLKRIRATTQADQRELAREVVDAHRDVQPSSLRAWERLLVAELAAFLCDDLEAARKMLTDYPRPRADEHGYHDEIPRSQHDWFRLFRLREHLGEPPNVDQVPVDNDNEFLRTMCLFTRHVARFGALAAKVRRELLPPRELIRELGMSLRFMSQRTGDRHADDDFRQVRRLRPAFVNLVLERIAAPDSLNGIAELVVSSTTGAHGEKWLLGERIEVFHHLVDAGVDLALCESMLDDIERDWPTDEPNASSRADREVKMAAAKNLLGRHKEAIGHLRAAVASHGTVDHSKDYQPSAWCTFLCRVNQSEPNDERRRQRTNLVVHAAVAAAQGDAPSTGAATAAIEDATRWNAQEGAALVEYLPAIGAIDFASAAGTFVTSAVRADAECAAIAAAITRCFLVPLDGPASELLTAIAGANRDSTLVASITAAIDPYALSENRAAWYRTILRASETHGLKVPAIPEWAKREDPTGDAEQATVSVGLDESITVNEACSSIETPDDFRKFRAAVKEQEWLRTHDLTEALCDRWDASRVYELAQVIAGYDKEGREVMTCAERLEQLGDVQHAMELSKSVLLTGGTGYGDDWRWGGPLARALEVLERILEPEELRELVLLGLHHFVRSTGGFSSSGTELFTKIFPRICSEDELLSIANHVEHFLTHATRVTDAEESWHRSSGTIREALLDFISSRLSHPVNFLAEAAQRTVVELLRQDALTDQDLHVLSSSCDDPRSIRGLLGALFAVAHDHPSSIRPLADWLVDMSKIRDLGLRAEVNMTLVGIGEDVPIGPPTDARILTAFTHESLVSPPRIAEEEVDSTGYLEDTYDPARLAVAFKPHIELLAEAAGLEAANVLQRVYDIAVSFGRDTWNKQAEMDLRYRMDKSSLRLTFQRLRAIAVERALHQAAAELIDAGRLSHREASTLLWALRTADPAVLRIEPQKRPQEITPFNPPKAYTGDKDGWFDECDKCADDVQKLLTRRFGDCFVLAERAIFRTGRDVCRESRLSNLWLGGVSPNDVERPLAMDHVAYASKYHSVASEDEAVAVSHFAGMDHHGSHREWLVLNSKVANILGLQPDDTRLFGWTDGDDAVWTIRWIDGHPLVPPDEGQRGHGWLVVGMRGVAEKLQDAFPDARRYCSIQRQKGESDNADASTACWNEAFIDDEPS